MSEQELFDWVRAQCSVDGTTGCWLWTGYQSENGYGRIRLTNRRVVRLHRWMYEHTNGPIGELLACHRDICNGRRNCVNPEHIYAGTQGDNTSDAVRNGRMKGRPAAGVLNGNSRIGERDVRDIRFLLSLGFTQKWIGALFGIHLSQVSNIKLGKQWAHVENYPG